MTKLDPRVRILWWIAISISAMMSTMLPMIAILIFLMALCWIWMGHGPRFTRFLLGLTPFLLIISTISLYPSFDINRAVVMSGRYLVLLGATRLFLLVTPYNEFTDAIRNLPPRKLQRTYEVIAFLLGFSLMSVPLAEQEWSGMKERLKMRGININSGSKLSQVRSGLRMIGPLILRVFDRMKYFFIAIIQYGYNPMEQRSNFVVLSLNKYDVRVAQMVLVFVVTWISLTMYYTQLV